MITRSILLLLLCEILKTIHAEKCSLFNKNNANVPSGLFEDIKEYAYSGVLDELFNITEIESIYNEFKSTKYNEDIDLNITELLTKYGYPVEQHEVQTSDGYLLTMFRIPNNGPVVFIMHGLISSSDDFVSTGPDSALAYLLADAGYDVWLGNARGNKYCRSHVSLSSSCAEFWDFSWDEIGRYDLPAMIDFVFNETNQKQLVYIGHSQGTTSYFVLCSEKPEYNGKIKLMVALSAVSYLANIKGVLLKIISSIHPFIWANLKVLGLYEFLPKNELVNFLTGTFCSSPATATILCDSLFLLLFGADFKQMNATSLPVIFGHTPSGVSTKQLVHYGQLINSGEFRQFDCGLKNLALYGSVTPPDYPIEKINSPVAIFFGHNDWLSTRKDVEKFKSKLPNLYKFITVPWNGWSHLDYLFAKDVKELLYIDILNLLEEYLSV